MPKRRNKLEACLRNGVVLLSGLFLSGSDALAVDSVRPFLQKHCFECHDGDVKKGNLDLTTVSSNLASEGAIATWVKVHDRAVAGEMPPAKKDRPPRKELDRAMGVLGKEITAVEAARQRRDGRSGVRRWSRVELENALRDLLGAPGLRVAHELPADGKAHGFDRAAAALDFSFVHQETYLAAVDKALNEATPAFTERPPVFKYRYRPWDNNRHGGREAEGSVVLNVSQKNFVPLIGLERDPTFETVKGWTIKDDAPHSTALGFFRHEDADFRFSLTAIAPVLSGPHKLRVSGYSFWWDGAKPVATDRAGAFGFGIHSTGEHFGTGGVPANTGGVAEISAWLARADDHVHGTDNSLRLIMASLEKVRDFAHGEGVKGPPKPCPGLAVEWIEIEGPLHEEWPPASQRALFGDLPAMEWKAESGRPKPVQQVWPRGKHGAHPKDPYGENGRNRPIVEIASDAPETDARRLLSAFLRRAFRRTVTEQDVQPYAAIVAARMQEGAHFQDALKASYRAALASPDFLLVGAARNQFTAAARLSALLWSSIPDETLLSLAERGRLTEPAALRAEAERMLSDPKAARFIADFTGQWLRLREIENNPPDTQLYPEFMPWLQESMMLETRAYFTELLKRDLGVAHFVQSDFAMLNEPLARHYGIPGVSGFAMRRVGLPLASERGGFLTQAAVLKVTANGTTTSPVTRGAFVMEKLLGIVPTPPPPGVGSIEPDTRGATTIRDQLEKHKRDTTCAGCHVKMDPYGFALESFDVVGQWRERYRARDDAGQAPANASAKPFVHGKAVKYHDDLPVDCTGQLPDGRPFRDVRELRAMLAADEEALARAFVGHLVTYATGAEVSFADRAEVTKILRRAKAKKFGVKTLLLEVIQSPLFTKN